VDVPGLARFTTRLSGSFESVSRSKEALYRDSGEEAYDEAGSPHPPRHDSTSQAEEEHDAVVTQLDPHQER
jgi:hypothetical protein